MVRMKQKEKKKGVEWRRKSEKKPGFFFEEKWAMVEDK